MKKRKESKKELKKNLFKNSNNGDSRDKKRKQNKEMTTGGNKRKGEIKKKNLKCRIKKRKKRGKNIKR